MNKLEVTMRGPRTVHVGTGSDPTMFQVDEGSRAQRVAIHSETMVDLCKHIVAMVHAGKQFRATDEEFATKLKTEIEPWARAILKEVSPDYLRGREEQHDHQA